MITFNELAGLGVPFTRVWLAKLMKAGRFPAAVKGFSGRIAWRKDEIELWVAKRWT